MEHESAPSARAGDRIIEWHAMIRFTKMQGIGNDYIYINAFEERVDDPVSLARSISDRHFGVGGDGLILVLPPDKGVDAHVRMRMFNADGSESEMCGNGIRCVCKLAHDRGISRANPMKVQTGRGVLTLNYTTNGGGTVERVTVDMGKPLWHADDVPVRVEELDDVLERLQQVCQDDIAFEQWAGGGELRNGDQVTGSYECWTEGVTYKFLSMGNPHIAFFVRDLKKIPLERVGPLVELHAAFPRRINAHFVQVHSRRIVTMRTWERGTGITLACGTGASAVCAAGAALNLTDREILAHLPGGDLNLRWDEKTNHVFMTGPATEVFSGEWPAAK
jgi:diaminopimelate epimerase